MEENEIIGKIRKILVSELKHENFEIHDGLSAADVEGWDSLSHMAIIAEIEKSFGVKFKLKELNKLNNMGNLITLLDAKIDEK
jgi:acyl carrier protein